VVKREPQIDSRNRGLVEEAGEREGHQILQEVVEAVEEVHQEKALEEAVGRSIEATEVAGGRSIEVKVVAGERLIGAQVVHLIEAREEAEEARCLSLEEGVQDEMMWGGVAVERVLMRQKDVKSWGVGAAREMLAPKAFLEAMEEEEFHLLEGRNGHKIVVFPLREEVVELRLDLVLEVALHCVVP
jgi:hypothetical protein